MTDTKVELDSDYPFTYGGFSEFSDYSYEVTEDEMKVILAVAREEERERRGHSKRMEQMRKKMARRILDEVGDSIQV